MRSPGLILHGYHSFPAVIQPLAVEVAPCFWLIDDQQGPFDSLWLFASPENEALVEKKRFEVSACINTSATCWRPRTFPRLAKHIIIDEYTYFIAMRCDESEVPRRVELLANRLGDFTGEFFVRLEQMADMFLCHGDGWWELYTPHLEWRLKFRSVFPASFERSWKQAGSPPVVIEATGKVGHRSEP